MEHDSELGQDAENITMHLSLAVGSPESYVVDDPGTFKYLLLWWKSARDTIFQKKKFDQLSDNV